MRLRLALLGLCLLLLATCERERRNFQPSPADEESGDQVVLSTISPGATPPVAYKSGKGEEFENNAYQVAQGKLYYAWFNCNGRHANGGGDSGPALMDDRWIYGGGMENIVQTIREGRPNGMPSFRGKIPDEQIWQIAAYVRSMGRYIPKDVAPSRRDGRAYRAARAPSRPLPAHLVSDAGPGLGRMEPDADRGSAARRAGDVDSGGSRLCRRGADLRRPVDRPERRSRRSP